jgi:hypothetical protein
MPKAKTTKRKQTSTTKRKNTKVPYWRLRLQLKIIAPVLLVAAFAGIGTYVLNPTHADGYINTVYGPSDAIITFTVNGPNTASDGGGYFISLNTGTSRFPFGDCTINGGGQIAISPGKVTTCSSPIYGRGGATQFGAGDNAFFQFQKMHIGSLATGTDPYNQSAGTGVINRIPTGYFEAGWSVKTNTTDGHMNCVGVAGCGLGFATGRLDLVLNILKNGQDLSNTNPSFDNTQSYPNIPKVDTARVVNADGSSTGATTNTSNSSTGTTGQGSSSNKSSGQSTSSGSANSAGSSSANGSQSGDTNSGTSSSSNPYDDTTSGDTQASDDGTNGVDLDSVSASQHEKDQQHRRNLALTVGLAVIAVGLAAFVVNKYVGKRA